MTLPPLRKSLSFTGLFMAICAPAYAAPITWAISDGGNGHSYEVVSGNFTWEEARAAAEQANGSLATIATKAENDFLFSLVNDPAFWKSDAYSGLGPWLGGYQLSGPYANNEGWNWVNSEGSFTYTNWAPGEPNNVVPNEDYLMFFAPGVGNRSSLWNDAPGSFTGAYIVEWSPAPSDGSPVPDSGSAIMLLGLAMVGIEGLRRRSTLLAQ